MKKLMIVPTVIGLLVVWTAPALAITWGWLDENHLNVGAMVVDFPVYVPFQWCSGTLIHPQVFLTAGHCTVDLAAYEITTVWVNFDRFALNPGTMRLVKQVLTHPDYHWGATSDPHNVGILVLAEPMEGIQPAVLPPLGFLNDLNAQGLLKRGAQRDSQCLASGFNYRVDIPETLDFIASVVSRLHP